MDFDEGERFRKIITAMDTAFCNKKNSDARKITKSNEPERPQEASNGRPAKGRRRK